MPFSFPKTRSQPKLAKFGEDEDYVEDANEPTTSKVKGPRVRPHRIPRPKQFKTSAPTPGGANG